MLPVTTATRPRKIPTISKPDIVFVLKESWTPWRSGVRVTTANELQSGGIGLSNEQSIYYRSSRLYHWKNTAKQGNLSVSERRVAARGLAIEEDSKLPPAQLKLAWGLPL